MVLDALLALFGGPILLGAAHKDNKASAEFDRKVSYEQAQFDRVLDSVTSEKVEREVRKRTEAGGSEMMKILTEVLTGTEIEDLLTSHVWIPEEATLVCMADRGKLPASFAISGMRAGGRSGGTRYDPKYIEESDAKSKMIYFVSRRMSDHGHKSGIVMRNPIGSNGNCDIYSRCYYYWRDLAPKW